MFLKPGPSLSSIWMPGPGIYVLPIESRSTAWIIFWTLPVEQRQTQMDMENPVTVLYFLILDCIEHVAHCIVIIFSIEIRWNKLGHCRWWKSPIFRHTPNFQWHFPHSTWLLRICCNVWFPTILPGAKQKLHFLRQSWSLWSLWSRSRLPGMTSSSSTCWENGWETWKPWMFDALTGIVPRFSGQEKLRFFNWPW